MGGEDKDQSPVRYCPDCGKKMSAFKRRGGWKYVCSKAAEHAQVKLKSRQGGGPSGKGGVRKGTPSPRRGRLADDDKPYRTRYDWRRKPKDEGDEK